MAEPTAAPHHHDCPSSSTASCSASTSYVHYDIFITPCSPEVCTFATALESKLVSRQLQVFFHKLNDMLEEEFTSKMEGVISVASVHIVIFSPYFAQWKWCLDSLVQIKKSGGTILPVFYKVKPCDVRWTGQDNRGLYAHWLRDHEDTERYDCETIQNWRDVLYQVSLISGFELEACNGGEEELLRKVVKSVFEDFPHLRYQVFLNHRGPDTKTTLASELYHRLTSGGLRVFLDQPELAEGFQISPQIEVAIQFASVHIAIFSPKYAESSWCLDELYLMIKSGAIIFPVFYKVKPSVLDGEYAEELLKHENSARYKSADIQRWRSALSEVAKIECFFEMNGNEQDVLKDIVQKVSDNVPKYSQVVESAEERSMVKSVLTEDVPNSSEAVVESYPEGYFGLAEKLIFFEKAVLLQHEKERVEVKVVGVVGAAGVGKTALAELFFTRKKKDYKEYAFLSYEKETGVTISRNHLQSDLIEALKHSANQWIMLLKHLSSRRALIILDHADQLDAHQLDDFLSIKSVLHPNSLILVTSSDKDLLKRSGIVDSSIYHLAGLTRAHSHKLFCFYATCKCKYRCFYAGFPDLVDTFLTACDGLPRSLIKFGRLLCTENRLVWLERLNWLDTQELPREICDTLQICYDSLNQEEQQIFIDACFFTGEETAARIWGLVGVSTLKNKCLVEVDQNKLKMHNHVRVFGRNIAMGLTPRQLWHETTNNIHDLLEQSSSVLSLFRGIMMMPLVDFRDLVNETEACLRSEMTYYRRTRGMFHGPKNLKFLAAQDGYVEDILRRVGSPGLIWLHWYKCPYSYLPSWVPMENLRVLEVAGSELTELWRPESPAPLQLRELNIFAPLSMFPKSIGQLKYLEKIVLNYFDDRPQPLRTLPDELCHLLSLKYLRLRKCSRMTKLPDSFGELTNLQYIDLKGASSLQMLPNSFGKLSLLKHLCLKDCCEIQEFAAVEHLTSLETLDVRGCQKLQTLDVRGCQKLQSIPGLGQLTKLRTLNVSGCSYIKELPGLEHVTSLETLDASGWRGKRQSIPVLGQLTKLRTLNVSECSYIKELPGLEHATSLETLDASGCKELQSIAVLGQLTKLQTLNVRGCSYIKELPGLEHATSLETLECSGCKELQSIPVLGQLTKLRTLNVRGCSYIKELPGLEHATSLETLECSGCKELQSIAVLWQLRKLQTLNVRGCTVI